MDALQRGIANLDRHLRNLREVYGLPVVVAVNRFPDDTDEELAWVKEHCLGQGAKAEISRVVAEGGNGGLELAQTVLDVLAEGQGRFKSLYEREKLSIKEKLRLLATEIYGAADVVYTKEADKAIQELEGLGYGKLPVCVAKTQMSLSDDPNLKGAPEGWTLTIREVRVSAGAGLWWLWPDNPDHAGPAEGSRSGAGWISMTGGLWACFNRKSLGSGRCGKDH